MDERARRAFFDQQKSSAENYGTYMSKRDKGCSEEGHSDQLRQSEKTDRIQSDTLVTFQIGLNSDA